MGFCLYRLCFALMLGFHVQVLSGLLGLACLGTDSSSRLYLPVAMASGFQAFLGYRLLVMNGSFSFIDT